MISVSRAASLAICLLLIEQPDFYTGAGDGEAADKGTLRAGVKTSMHSVPAALRTRAHSLTVLPVVKTSSTSSTLFPRTWSGRARAKAPFRFSRRALPFKEVCGAVARGRLSRLGAILRRQNGKQARAISMA